MSKFIVGGKMRVFIGPSTAHLSPDSDSEGVPVTLDETGATRWTEVTHMLANGGDLGLPTSLEEES